MFNDQWGYTLWNKENCFYIMLAFISIFTEINMLENGLEKKKRFCEIFFVKCRRTYVLNNGSMVAWLTVTMIWM